MRYVFSLFCCSIHVEAILFKQAMYVFLTDEVGSDTSPVDRI